MTCEDYQRKVSRLVDRESSSDESAKVFTHLGECVTCRLFFRAVMDTNQMLTKDEHDVQHVLQPPRLTILAHASLSLRSIAPPRLSTVALLIVIGLFIVTLFSTSISNADNQAEPADIPVTATIGSDR